MNRDELGNRLTMFGDKDTIRVYSIEQRQTLLLEFSGGYRFHTKTIVQSRLYF